jgi:Domain of unknown function (DUF1844)
MSEQDSGKMGAEERITALFAQMVLQQTNMALMLLGKIAHPQSGEIHKDVEAARMFIDQLEMLEAKTRGNLSKDESGLLKQSLMNLRLAFVEAVDTNEPKSEPQQTKPEAAEGTQAGEPTAATSSSSEDEHRKKFSKKY